MSRLCPLSPAPPPCGMKAVNAAWRNQPSQTLSPVPFLTTRFMPSFQSPVPHQGKPMQPSAIEASRARAQCSNTVASLVGHARSKEAVVLARLERLAFEERDFLIKDGEVSGRANVMGDRIGEPRHDRPNTGAYTLTQVGQPPMLNIAFDELARGGAERCSRVRHGLGRQRAHAVLQLIPEAIGAAA